ncbi:MAG: hypothetical protein ACR2MQ_16080 [Gemmatimonadaceae bacterium]
MTKFHLHFASVVWLIAVAACGGDNGTSPRPASPLNTGDALASLANGMDGVSGSVLPAGSTLTSGALSALPSAAVGQATVQLDGIPTTLFALGMRTTYPAGTCLERLVGAPSISSGTSCTAPPGGLMLILWQTESASLAPDRIILIMADLGSVNFADLSNATAFVPGASFPPIAIYLERSGALWFANAGSLSSAAVSTAGTCTTPRVGFIAAATCGFATFASTGHISFAPLPFTGSATTGSHSLDISASAIPGIVTNVTSIATTR